MIAIKIRNLNLRKFLNSLAKGCSKIKNEYFPDAINKRVMFIPV
jgi:hypothetical protein